MLPATMQTAVQRSCAPASSRPCPVTKLPVSSLKHVPHFAAERSCVPRTRVVSRISFTTQSAQAEAPPQPTVVNPTKPITKLGIQDKALLHTLVTLSKLSQDVKNVNSVAVSGATGLQLVTSSCLCETPIFVPTDTMDDEMDDGMGVPLAEVKRAAELMAKEVGEGSPQSDWQPSESKVKTFSGAPGGSVLDQLNARQDQTYVALPDQTLLSKVQSGITKAAAKVAEPLASTVTTAAKAASGIGSRAATATIAAVKNAGKPAAAEGVDEPEAVPQRKASLVPMTGDPKSDWLVVDDSISEVRYLVLNGPEELGRQQRLANSDLTTFESYSLGVKINRKIYAEASALYARFIPLVMDFLEEKPNSRICLVGAGIGGSLATVLMLMFVHRGLRRDHMMPVYALNAPAVLGEVPDYKLWCNKESCTQGVDEIVAEVMSRGVLAEMGLNQDAVRNILVTSSAAVGLKPNSSSSSSNVVALPSWSERLPSWLRGTDRGTKAAGAVVESSSKDPRNLQIFSPIGQIMMYEGEDEQ